jgi:peptidyl-tRNA hydrolase
MKQLIIARKDLNMSPGKLAAQVSHASMAFLTNGLRTNEKKVLNCSRGYAWEMKPIPTCFLERYRKDIEEQKRLADQMGHGYEYIAELVQVNELWYMRRPQWYKRNDLHQWAKEARERGDEYFYYRLVDPNDPYGKLELCEPTYHYQTSMNFDTDVWENWICGSFTKIICEAKNKYQLEKVITLARELGLEENKDFFLIKDNCYTELTPEEIDENGVCRTLTCIGFRPLPDDICAQLSKKYQLYK